jgi:hypothetical protein
MSRDDTADICLCALCIACITFCILQLFPA